MSLWIAWSVLASALFAIAAAGLDRAASYLGAPRRFVWIAAILATTAAPALLATRRAPTDQTVLPSAYGTSQPRAARPVANLAQNDSSTAMSVLQTRSMTVLERAAGGAFASWTRVARRADPWLAIAWLLASVGMGSGLVREVIRLRRRQSTWSNVHTEFGDVLVAPDVGPAVVGFRHPRIVVSPWTLSADRTTRDLLLRHELEHLRAGDTRVLLLAEVALILLPWNAALWWMTQRLRLAIELDCDARVVRATGGAHAYGLVLLSVGERYATGEPLATSFSGSRLNLELRIDAMTAPRKRYPVAAALPFVGITLGVLSTAAWVPRPTPLLSARAKAIAVAVQTPSAPGTVHSSITHDSVAATAHQRIPDSVSSATGAATPPQEPNITVNFDNAPIMDVLNTFAQYSHHKIAAAGVLTGTLTGTVHDQPWRAAFKYLLNTNGYDFTVAADSALVVDSVRAVQRRDSVPPRVVRDTTLADVGYVYRKQGGFGFFIDGKQIDGQAAAFSEMMRTVPGFRVAPSTDGRSYVISDAQNAASGCVNYFVDGRLWQTTEPGDIDAAVRPAQVVAIEAYKGSSTPSQFVPRDQNRCATIVVWTRSRVKPD